MRQCFCFAPECPECFPQLEEGQGQAGQACACFLPGCPKCFGPGAAAASSDPFVELWKRDVQHGACKSVGQGQPWPASARKLVSNVDILLQVLLDEGVLSKGPAWNTVQKGSKGNKYDAVVARLVHAPVRSVLRLRTLRGTVPGNNLGSPSRAGRKKSAAPEGPNLTELQASEQLMPAEPVQLRYPFGVPPIKDVTAENARIALALGRAAFDSILHGTEFSYVRTVRQLYLAGVPVGHQHHDRHICRSLAHAAKALLCLDTRKLLQKAPPNMDKHQLVPLWSLECDSVTRSACSPLVMLSVFPKNVLFRKAPKAFISICNLHACLDFEVTLKDGTTLFPIVAHLTGQDGKMLTPSCIQKAGLA